MTASRESTRLTGLTAGGTDGNERLTVQTGALLLVMLAALGVTIVRIGQLTWLHLFLGLLLIGPVMLKLASTGYRFARYYSSAPAYRHKGPPLLALRLMAPVVVLSTLVVFASGVALLALGPSGREPLLLVHKVAFFVWLGFTGVHVLGHLPALRHGLLGGPLRTADLQGLRAAVPRPGGSGRAIALATAIGGGLTLAMLLIPEFAPWVHHRDFFHNH